MWGAGRRYNIGGRYEINVLFESRFKILMTTREPSIATGSALSLSSEENLF